MNPLVLLRGATVRLVHPHGPEVLSGLDFTLCAGRHLAVVGDNGAGKTTFLRLLRGDIWPQDPASRQYFDAAGQPDPSPIVFREASALVSPETAEEWRRSEYGASVLETVLSGLGNSPYFQGAPTDEQLSRAQGLLAAVGAEHLARRGMDEVSEGQAKLVLILRALMGRPRVLFLDEVGDGLDAATRPLLLGLLNAAAGNGTQLVQSGHRLGEFCPAIQDVVVMEQGRIVARGGRELLESTRRQAPQVPQALQTPLPQSAVGQPLVELAGVSAVLAGRQVLFDVAWTIRQGQGWVLSGSNGAGKSTLLKILAGDLYPLAGATVRRFGSAEPRTLWELRGRLGLVSFADQAFYNGEATFLDTVLSGFDGTVGMYRQATAQELATARQLLDSQGVGQLADQPLQRLSFGQRRLALILRALVHGPELLLLDEPLSGLSARAAADVGRFLSRLALGGLAMVVVCHRPGDLPPELSLELRLEAGRVVHDGLRRE